MLQKMVNFQNIKSAKEKIIGFIGSLSGITGFLGSWQVCHNICLLIVAFLSVLGITILGMPLLFLTKIALPLWITAVILLLILIILLIKKKCISKKLVLFNSGVIIAGIPFQKLENFLIIFWILGGLLVILSIFLYIKEKIKKVKKS